ncbi:restriction endonuclease [bacterium]|nr:restriction endonuclease [bacterium]
MAIPRYDEIQLPILNLLSDDQPRKARDMVDLLAPVFNLSEEENLQMYASGNGPIFVDRIQWALSYLNMAGLVQKPRRGIYQISEQGTKILKNPRSLREYVNNKISEREPNKKKDKVKTELSEDLNSDLTPEESLYQSFDGIKKSVYRDILDTILSKTPREFEKLVVILLQKMGYGGEIKNSGEVTQYVNDKGIDGIIREDVLGFGRINIQAKRYAVHNNVPREDIQKFVGALAVAQSDKGVFITTSDFTKGAYQYAESLNSTTKIVLINGDRLAQYIYDFNLGVQPERTIEIKKLDSDFWDFMQDNPE